MATFPVKKGSLGRIDSTIRQSAFGLANRQVDATIGNITQGNIAAAGALTGAVGALATGGSLKGALEGAVSGAANALIGNAVGQLQGALSQLPNLPGLPNLQGVLGEAFGSFGGVGGAGGVTFSGTSPASNYAPQRTSIVDPAGEAVEITIDSFLQGVQGSLSSIGGGNIFGAMLGGALGGLLNSTGLTGSLASIGGAFGGALNGALGGLSNALGQAAGGLAQGIGKAISSIPGVGPVFGQFTRDVGGLVSNINGAINRLPADQKALMQAAAVGVGANLVNRAIRSKPNISAVDAVAIAANLEFDEHPAVACKNVSDRARELHTLCNPTINDPLFDKLYSSAREAAIEFDKEIIRKSNGRYGLRKQTTNERIEQVRKVINGSVFLITE
jgi:hypothetical protein